MLLGLVIFTAASFDVYNAIQTGATEGSKFHMDANYVSFTATVLMVVLCGSGLITTGFLAQQSEVKTYDQACEECFNDTLIGIPGYKHFAECSRCGHPQDVIERKK